MRRNMARVGAIGRGWRVGVLLSSLLAAPIAASLSAQTDSVVALQRRGLAEEALRYARGLASARPDDAGALDALVVAALGAGDPKLAAATSDRLVEVAPRSSRYWFDRGRAYLVKAQRSGMFGAFGAAKTGRKALERAVELDLGNLDARDWLVGFHLKAPAIVGGHEREARRQAAEIARRDSVRGMLAELQIAMDRKDRRALVALFDRLLPFVASPTDSVRAVSLALLGIVGSVKGDSLQEALAARAYAAHPDDPFVRYERARFWVERGEHLDEAERLLRAYIARAPEAPGLPPVAGAHWRLGQALEKRGLGAAALAEYRTAARLRPDLAPVRDDLERLEKRERGG